MAIKRILIILTLGFTFLSSKAQDDIHGDPEVWFLLLNHYEINNKWTVGNELHLRRTDWFGDQKQYIIRPFVNFKPGEKVVYTAGYSYIEAEPYGECPLIAALPEHNVWEQVTVNQKLNQSLLSHRYRMEHRYQGNLIEESAGSGVRDGFQFSNRFSYRLTWKHPISDEIFIHAFDELWINLDGKMRQASYNQNWLYVGLGKNLKQGNIQIAYLHQHASSNGIVERHPSVQLTLQYDFKSK